MTFEYHRRQKLSLTFFYIGVLEKIDSSTSWIRFLVSGLLYPVCCILLVVSGLLYPVWKNKIGHDIQALCLVYI